MKTTISGRGDGGRAEKKTKRLLTFGLHYGGLTSWPARTAGLVNGPGSSVCWVCAEYAGILFAKPRILSRMAYYGTLLLLFPLNHLDRWIIKRNEAHVVASGFFFYGKKP